jgi:hypothetical protein
MTIQCTWLVKLRLRLRLWHVHSTGVTYDCHSWSLFTIINMLIVQATGDNFYSCKFRPQQGKLKLHSTPVQRLNVEWGKCRGAMFCESKSRLKGQLLHSVRLLDAFIQNGLKCNKTFYPSKLERLSTNSNICRQGWSQSKESCSQDFTLRVSSSSCPQIWD